MRRFANRSLPPLRKLTTQERADIESILGPLAWSPSNPFGVEILQPNEDDNYYAIATEEEAKCCHSVDELFSFARDWRAMLEDQPR